jgi:hypothetical protein
MREAIYFIASLAGAAVLTALAILVPPDSPFWRNLLYGGIGVLIVCALGLAIDIARRWWRKGHKPEERHATSGIRVSGRDNVFVNVDTVGFGTGIDIAKTGKGNIFKNVSAQSTASEEIRALDDLFAEGVQKRNGLIPPIKDFDYISYESQLTEWKKKVLILLEHRPKDFSKIRTLNLYTPKSHKVTYKTVEQEHLESIWNELLDRLRAIIDGI